MACARSDVTPFYRRGNSLGGHGRSHPGGSAGPSGPGGGGGQGNESLPATLPFPESGTQWRACAPSPGCTGRGHLPPPGTRRWEQGWVRGCWGRGATRDPPEPGDPGQAPPSPGDTSVQRHRAGEPTPQPGHGHSPPLQLDGHARPTPADSPTRRETPRPQAPRRRPHRAPDLDLHTARGHVHPGAGTQPGRPAWAHAAPARPASPAAWPSPRRAGPATPTRSPHSMDTPVQPDTQTQTHPRSLADNGPRHPPAPWAGPAPLRLRSPGTGAQRGPGLGAPRGSRPGPSAPRRDRRVPGPRSPASSCTHRPVSQGTPASGQGATMVNP